MTKINEIVGACLSQFHGDDNNFELLLAYADGREVGFCISRRVAQKMASELVAGVGAPEKEELLEALQAVASILPKYEMKGDTASDDEALSAVLETVNDALAKYSTSQA